MHNVSNFLNTLKMFCEYIISTIHVFTFILILSKIEATVIFEELESLPGMLYPQENKLREVKSLDGLWDFGIISNSVNKIRNDTAMKEWVNMNFWNTTAVMQIPVPSSYNDIVISAEIRDHVGAVWYARNFFIHRTWIGQRIFIRFGSVNYYTSVWINNRKVMDHELGHLPFEAEITEYLKFHTDNRIIVVVDNVLSKTSVPQGKITEEQVDNGTSWVQSHVFDFFNYAGIQRPVLLHTKPIVYIDDITVKTSTSGDTGIIYYNIKVKGYVRKQVIRCSVYLVDINGMRAIERSFIGCIEKIEVPNARLWWPRGMSSRPAYMYTLNVQIYGNLPEISDVYLLQVGIRTLKWTNTSLLLNNKPVYMRGFGRHEDSVLRGRGLDLVTMTRDYELLKWVGANAYRTSHYPYSDEVMDMADRQGFLIINECPSVDTENFTPTLLALHKSSISQLIRRDKNRPSVIMWSIANEPRIWKPKSTLYFKQIAEFAKKLDPLRPITAVVSKGPEKNSIGQFLDVICFNKYNAWYDNTGKLNMITNQVINEAETWYAKFEKPVIMSEYGADAIAGFHELPESPWSEEYQAALLSQHFKAFDYLRNKYSWFIGELIWNFADFQTPPSPRRAGGNKKGIFTRNREPKMAAYLVRKRYHTLAFEIDQQEAPESLEYYISSHNATCTFTIFKN